MPDNHLEAVLPANWQRARGYSYAMVSQGGRTVRVAGQIAVVKGKGPVDPALDFGQQFDRALGNLVTIVDAAGGIATDIAALRAYVTDIDAFNAAGAAIGEAWGRHLGKHFPAMTLVEVSKLLDPNAMVEIEAEAVIPEQH